MVNELFDVVTVNQVGVCQTEEAALVEVHAPEQRSSAGAVATVALVREDDSGNTTVIASGAARARLAATRVREADPSACSIVPSTT